MLEITISQIVHYKVNFPYVNHNTFLIGQERLSTASVRTAFPIHKKNAEVELESSSQV